MKRPAIMWCTRYCNICWCLLILLTLMSGCDRTVSVGHQATVSYTDTTKTSAVSELPHDTFPLEHYLISKQLVDVQKLEPGIRVALLYATDQNFLHKPIYTGLNKCYLPCEVAIKLCNAEYYLNQRYPQCHIIVFDAVRPLHIQKQMWDELDLPPAQKINYLAHPADISLHNYGAAVDVGIITNDQLLLNMGTSFDSFSELSQPKHEARFLKEGLLSQEAYHNRLMLRQAMLQAGFSVMHTEWWHFNATNKATAAARYTLIE